MKKRVFSAILVLLLILHPGSVLAAQPSTSFTSNLDIAFDPAQLYYFVMAPQYTEEFAFTLIPQDPDATLELNGQPLEGSSGKVSLDLGLNTVMVGVVSQKVTTTYTFAIVVPVCSGGSDCPSAHFSDMGSFSAWYHQGVDYCLIHKLMTGTSPTTFSPGNPTTRGQFITVLWRNSDSPAPEGVSPFHDLTQDYYKDAIAWAWEKGIAKGTDTDTFSPESSISRQDLAVLLYRYSQIVLGLDVSKSASLKVFPDNDKVASYAQEALSWAVAENLITGSLDGVTVYLLPHGSATRGQIATIIMRYCEKIIK